MSSRIPLSSITSTPRRVTLPLLLLAAGVLLLIKSSTSNFPYLPDATVFDKEGSAGLNGQQGDHLGAYKASGSDRLGSAEFPQSLNRQNGIVASDAPARHQNQKEKEQWYWDWLKEATAKKVKESFGWKSEQDAEAHSSRLGDKVIGDSDADDSYSSSLSYHHHLDKEHSPHGYLRHSPTLTFGHIYVLSLPHRTDRRSRMSKIARALGFEFTFVDATSKEAPVVGWIAERVKEIRDRKRRILSEALSKPEEEIGGLGTDSIWLKGEDAKLGLSFPDLRKIDQRWTLETNINLDESAKDSLGQGSIATNGVPLVDWVTYLESDGKVDSLRPSNDAVSVSELLHDPVEPLDARQVNDGVVATWYSQTRVWKKIVENKDASALIMEDDVDIEWDIEHIWPNVERALPKDWEIVFLGHCWGRELANPHYVHPALHQANEPRCLHGYALSQRGAQHLLEIFSDPWRAYQTPVDTFMPYLTRMSPATDTTGTTGKPIGKDSSRIYIQAYSMEPPVIIQSKELSSDIQEGVGSSWRGLLADSTWDRILRDEGQDVKQLTWNDIKSDPAVRPRPWGDRGRRKKPAVQTKTSKVLKQPDEAKVQDAAVSIQEEKKLSGGAGKSTYSERNKKSHGDIKNSARMAKVPVIRKDKAFEQRRKH